MIEPPRPFDPSGRPLPAPERWRARVVIVLGAGASWLASLSGCGGATAGAPSSMDAGGAKDGAGYELATLDDAQAALDSAESRLASFGVGSGAAAAPSGTSAPPTQPYTQGQTQGQPGLSPLGEPAQPGVVQDRCVTACDALGSMRRAADRVCVLAPGERCDSATARVGAAEKRVFDACPGCSA